MRVVHDGFVQHMSPCVILVCACVCVGAGFANKNLTCDFKYSLMAEILIVIIYIYCILSGNDSRKWVNRLRVTELLRAAVILAIFVFYLNRLWV